MAEWDKTVAIFSTDKGLISILYKIATREENRSRI